MLTIRDCAILSHHIYYPKRDVIDGMYIGEVTMVEIYDGWQPDKKYSFYRMLDVGPRLHSSHHGYAQLYIKFQNGKATDAVMSIRGTVETSFSDLWEDLRSFTSDVIADASWDKIPHYMAFAHGFYARTKRYLFRYYPHLAQRLVFTGHSLGGAIAQLLVLLNYFLHPAVVFNSPGVGHMPKINLDYSSFIHNINSKYGIINKVGKLVNAKGTQWIDVPNHEEEAKILFENFNESLYKESEKTYEAAGHASNIFETTGEDMIALEERVDSLFSSEQALKKFELSKALANGDQLFYDLMSIIDFDIPQDYEAIILAQHSIAHLVQALAEKAYQPIATLSV